MPMISSQYNIIYLRWDRGACMGELKKRSILREVICLVEAIANLKSCFLIQVVFVWKHSAECPGDGCTWSKCWARNLLTYLVNAVKCRNGAI